ncbi:MAG TPA: type VI secretion system baseplate subunit TssG [Pseudomonadota bacterium]|jgi:type VI secretion system protein ImpH|nr:type VI secretion system baseplate subunit TssG [Pseudomonadota bacterium]
MATTGGGSEPPVIEDLQQHPYRYNFYQLVRLLEMLRPKGASVGASGEPALESVRFHSSFALSFPASEVQEVRLHEPEDESYEPADVSVNFLGIGGAHGPLPHGLTEWVLERNAQKDFALRDFLDIFNHRLVSLLFRIRRHNRLGMETTSPETHHFAQYLMAMLGLLTGGLQNRLRVPDRALLRYAGLLTKHPRDAAGLEVMLRDFFGVPARCLQLRGALRLLDEDQWTTIGQRGRNNGLCQGAMLGTTVWDQQAGIEIEMGPLPWKRYLDFLPGQPGQLSLVQLVRFYIGPSFDIHISLILDAEQIPETRLAAPQATQGSALGLTAFLTQGAPLHGRPCVQLGVIKQYSEEPLRNAP